jgi:hypothetical protein
MTHYTKRCKHCKSTYTYQGSGDGCFRPMNDDTYCPVCKAVIIEALKTIPKKFDSVFVETDEVTYDYLLEKRREKETGGLCTRRVYASLFNTKTGEAEKNDAFDVDNRQYLVQYWPSKREDMKIKVLKEKNLLTGEITGYWRDYR